MGAEFIRLYPENPEEDKILQIVEVIRDGGLIIYPTDTVYGLGCDIFNNKALERLKLIKGIKGKNINTNKYRKKISFKEELCKIENNTVN